VARYALDPRTLLRIVTDDVQIHPANSLVAPNPVRSQAMALLYERVRNKELDEAEALQLHERLTQLKIRLLGDRVSRRTAWRIAAEHDWPSIESAEYLAVARLQADALVTVDEELAAKADGIVPVAPLEALTVADGVF
jgi:predicted nucleic acid-binding protein